MRKLRNHKAYLFTPSTISKDLEALTFGNTSITF